MVIHYHINSYKYINLMKGKLTDYLFILVLQGLSTLSPSPKDKAS